MEKTIKIYKWHFIFFFNEQSKRWDVKDFVNKAILLSGYLENGIVRFDYSNDRIHYFFDDLLKKVKVELKNK